MRAATTVMDIQRRFRELGRIRLGAKGDRGQPQRLTHFRLTSASEELLKHAAGVYGGQVRPWAGAPTEGYWELFTEVDTLDIAIPPSQTPYTQAYELWSGGGCQRRCDGVTATVVQGNGIRERDCMCNPEHRECSLTTRVNLMLPRLPDVGVWRLETKGYNAAVELPGTLDLLSYATEAGGFIQGVLRIEERMKKVAGEKFPRRFIVPVIDLQTTMGDLIAGTPPALTPAPAGRPELPAGPVVDGEDVPVREEVAPPLGSPPPLPTAKLEPDVPEPPKETKPPPVKPEWDERPVTPQQRRRLMGIANELHVEADTVRRIARFVSDGKRGLGDLARGDYEKVVSLVEAYPENREAAEELIGGIVLPSEER